MCAFLIATLSASGFREPPFDGKVAATIARDQRFLRHLMAGAVDLGRRFYFLLVSIITVGIVLAILITALVYGQRLHLFDYDARIRTWLIIIMSITVIIFLFTVWISCHPNHKTRIALCVFFMLYSLGIITLAVLAFVRQKSIIPDLENLWGNVERNADDKTIVETIEDAYHCCGWADQMHDPECSAKRWRTCRDPVSDDVKQYWYWAAAVLLIFGILLLVATIFAIRIVSTELSEQAEKRARPSHGSTFGEPPDSKGTYKYAW
jgi:isoprenylcysteine carboxyl methyltransferase (ICMT) family protein YpbQ